MKKFSNLISALLILLLEKQQIIEVDGMSGASYSRYRFRYAVMIALMQARLANEKL